MPDDLERAERRVALGDARQRRLGGGARGQRPGAHFGSDCGSAAVREGVHGTEPYRPVPG
jgi:hypothetical protein